MLILEKKSTYFEVGVTEKVIKHATSGHFEYG